MAIMHEAVLAESRTLRSKTMGRVDVLDKVKALALLPDGTHATTEIVASYYEVDSEAIKKLTQRHREEFAENGLRVLRGSELQAFERDILSLSKRRALTLFTRRAVLNVGMLLTESEVARSVRTYLLNAEESSRTTLDQFTQVGVTMRWEDAAFIARTKFAFNVTVGELRSLLQSAGILTLTGRPHTVHERMFEFAPSGTRYEPHAVVVPWLIAEAMRTRHRLIEASHRAQLGIPGGTESAPQITSGA